MERRRWRHSAPAGPGPRRPSSAATGLGTWKAELGKSDEGRLLADTTQPLSCQTRAICELCIDGSVKKALDRIGACDRDLAGCGIDAVPCPGRGVVGDAEG